MESTIRIKIGQESEKRVKVTSKKFEGTNGSTFKAKDFEDGSKSKEYKITGYSISNKDRSNKLYFVEEI